MAGGPSTPELVAAVSQAGGLGFLAAGYKGVDAVRAEIAEVRRLTDRPFGVNVFLPGAGPPDPAAVAAYRERLAPVAARLGVEPGEPRWDDDEVAAKLDLVAGVPVVSLTFGCPSREQVAALQGAGSAVLVTVTSVEEARQALRRARTACGCRAPRPARTAAASPTTTARRRPCRCAAARRRTGGDGTAARRRRRADGRRGRGRASPPGPPGPGSAPRSSAARRPGRSRPTWRR